MFKAMRLLSEWMASHLAYNKGELDVQMVLVVGTRDDAYRLIKAIDKEIKDIAPFFASIKEEAPLAPFKIHGVEVLIQVKGKNHD